VTATNIGNKDVADAVTFEAVHKSKTASAGYAGKGSRTDLFYATAVGAEQMTGERVPCEAVAGWSSSDLNNSASGRVELIDPAIDDGEQVSRPVISNPVEAGQPRC